MRAVIGRCLWSIRVQTWMTSRENCFLCFVQHGARFWKCLRDYFELSKWRPLEKVSRSCLQTRKRKSQGESVLVYLKLPKTKLPETKLPETNLQSRCYHNEKTHSFENIYSIILLWVSEGLGKKLEEAAVYKYDKKEKKKPTQKVALVTLKMPELAQIEQSSAARQVCHVSFLLIV